MVTDFKGHTGDKSKALPQCARLLVGTKWGKQGAFSGMGSTWLKGIRAGGGSQRLSTAECGQGCCMEVGPSQPRPGMSRNAPGDREGGKNIPGGRRKEEKERGSK